MDTRAIVFWEEGFPFVDTVEFDPKRLIEALPPMESVRSVGVDELKKVLERESVDLLINPCGSAFPKAAWPQIQEFLAAGGNLLNLGGVPFSVPVRKEGEIWKQEVRQTAYHRELGIDHAFPVETADLKSYNTIATEPLLSGLVGEFTCDRVFELQVRLAHADGTREAVLRPLLYALASEKDPRRIAAPIVAIDRIFGSFVGGRWVFANFTSGQVPRKEILFRLAGFAAMGACDFRIQPSFSCYYPDERASVVVHANRFEKPGTELKRLNLFMTIRKDKISVARENVEIADFRSPYYHVLPVGIPLSPGPYTVEVRLSTGDAELGEKFASHAATGFWCYDAALVSLAQPLSAGKDFLARENKASPVIGTTYIASDVHRGLGLEPNPAVWEENFAEMKAAGVNIVRTGIWMGFRDAMLDIGPPDERLMRTLTAFLHSACQHEMTVIMTVFAFPPETWKGVNPYLDPRSLQAQKEFVAALARRFGKFNNLIWDLIDEPSFLSFDQAWARYPSGDVSEEKAWRDWLKAHHPSEDDLQESWRVTPCSSEGLPESGDLEERRVYEGTVPLRALDYRLFAQEVFGQWVRELAAVIRQNGNPKQPITVSQDGGGAVDRPNPQFHWDEVDFTSAHASRLSDDLLWAGLMGRAPEKPNLVREVSIVSSGNPDRGLRWTEKDCRNLLERKFVAAFASGATGAIEWMWSTGFSSGRGDEAGIGFHRADMTRKPELEILPPMAEFIKEARPLFVNRQPEGVCMIIPYSNMFSVRDHASAATRACVRAMHYRCGMPMRAVGEYALENLGKPRMIVLPSPGVLSRDAWETLVKAVEAGAVLLATGPIEWDEYRRPVERLSRFGIETEVRPVSREEEVIVFGSEYRLSFGGEKPEYVDKALIGGLSGVVRTEAAGAGKLIYTPLPFELADNLEATAALYEFALKQAGIDRPFSMEKIEPGILIRPQVFDEAVFYSVVSETDTDKQFDLTDALTSRTLTVKVPAQRAIMFLLSRPDGHVLAQYGGGVEKDEGVPRSEKSS